MLAFLASHVLKVKFHRYGSCIGSVYRWHGRIRTRGIVMQKIGITAEIHYRDGRVEMVKQS